MNRKHQKVKQPVPKLPAWIVITTLMEFYGHKNQVVDLLKRLHRASWVYLESHHKAMLFKVLKEHRFAPYNDTPQFLDYTDVKRKQWNESSYQDKNIQTICNSWNNREFTDLTQVILKIANELKMDYLSYASPQHTTWALLIKESDYK